MFKLLYLGIRDLQYTPSEERAVRMVNSEIQIYNPAAWSKGAVDKLRVEGVSAIAPSPGQYPALAVFVAEKRVWMFKMMPRTEALTDEHTSIGCTRYRQSLQSDGTVSSPFLLQDLLQGRQSRDQME